MTGITNPLEEYFKDGQWGWDGTRWRKLNLTFGYYNRLADIVTYTMPGAATYNLYSSAVPAGYLWLVQSAGSMNSLHAVTQQIFAWDTVNVVPLQALVTPALSVWNVYYHPGLVLKPGDQLVCAFGTCTANDVLWLKIWGYIMAIT